MNYWQTQIFSQQQVSNISNTVISLARHYETKENKSLSTLGLAAYQLDTTIAVYRSRTRFLNQILWENFSDYYRRIIEYFEWQFNCQICFEYNTSIPGFHIYKIGDLESFHGGSPHFDLSYKKLGLEVFESSLPVHYSFTIPITLPTSGSGLVLWDLKYDGKTSGAESIEALLQSSEKIQVDYEVGKMVVFNGYQYHQIAPVNSISKGDVRITLQGHLLRHNSHYIMYW